MKCKTVIDKYGHAIAVPNKKKLAKGVLPYDIPEFEYTKDIGQTFSYHWWSWHPCYPYWSKSCWNGRTIKEATESLKKPLACKMKYFHNKLVREGDGKYTVVLDKPTETPEVWTKLAKEFDKYI